MVKLLKSLIEPNPSLTDSIDDPSAEFSNMHYYNVLFYAVYSNSKVLQICPFSYIISISYS